MEMHAWSVTKEANALKRKGRRGAKNENEGSYLDEIRGLNFRKVLERLVSGSRSSSAHARV
eukprot:SAG11_NODE_2053_length_3878_cov_2.361207_3_plen_61_part_00